MGLDPPRFIDVTLRCRRFDHLLEPIVPVSPDLTGRQESDDGGVHQHVAVVSHGTEVLSSDDITEPMPVRHLVRTRRRRHRDLEAREALRVHQPDEDLLEVDYEFHVHNLANGPSLLFVPELTQRDPGVLNASLTTWLRGTLGGDANPEIIDLNAPASSGFSNETILLTARWSEGDERAEHRLVVRVHPTQHTLFLEADFSLQYNVMHALQDQERVPVPNLRWYEDDPETLGVPFFVMDHVEGQIPADNLPYTMEGWLLDSAPEQQATLWWSGIDTLAEVHLLDWRGLGLGYLAEDTFGAPGLDRNMNYYRSFLDWTSKGRPQPTTEAIWDWLIPASRAGLKPEVVATRRPATSTNGEAPTPAAVVGAP